jgi:hypothetical protein
LVIMANGDDAVDFSEWATLAGGDKRGGCAFVRTGIAADRAGAAGTSSLRKTRGMEIMLNPSLA